MCGAAQAAAARAVPNHGTSADADGDGNADGAAALRAAFVRDHADDPDCQFSDRLVLGLLDAVEMLRPKAALCRAVQEALVMVLATEDVWLHPWFSAAAMPRLVDQVLEPLARDPRSAALDL
jgi:hypothetical protein